ncbi:MAG: hypothetical protein ACYTG0_25170 [Planctomycetota bacterium]|jgi:hypothetical protein
MSDMLEQLLLLTAGDALLSLNDDSLLGDAELPDNEDSELAVSELTRLDMLEVLWLLNDWVLCDTVEGLLPESVLQELDEFVLPDDELLNASELVETLHSCAVLLLEQLAVEAVLHELCELALEIDRLDTRLDEMLDALHPWLVELRDCVDVLLMLDDTLCVDCEELLDRLLTDEAVEGVDQLLDSLERRLEVVELDAVLADDWARL